jgi:F-type H+-transporting ATPase subunit epsilon
MPVRCEVVTQDRLLFDGPADLVLAPGVQGELGILPNHAPLLTSLDLGVLRVRYQGQETAFTIAGGVMEVRPDVVIVLADVGESVAEIDLDRAEKARTRAEELLKRVEGKSPEEYLAAEAALRRSKLRLEAAKRFRPPSRRRPTAGAGEGQS